MQAANLLEFVRRQPFKPFRVTLTDGRTYQVQHPELAMVGRSVVVIGIPAPDDPNHLFDRAITVDLLHIMEAEHLPTSAASSS